MGRTPLIKLSPKKTWEGFMGGALVTLAASWYLAAFMSRYKWMTCERNVRPYPKVLSAKPWPSALLNCFTAKVPRCMYEPLQFDDLRTERAP